MATSLVGLKELREHTQHYIEEVKRGKSFVVIRKTKPVFKIAPIGKDEGVWEEVIDFTKIRKGGVRIEEILSRL